MRCGVVNEQRGNESITDELTRAHFMKNRRKREKSIVWDINLFTESIEIIDSECFQCDLMFDFDQTCIDNDDEHGDRHQQKKDSRVEDLFVWI